MGFARPYANSLHGAQTKKAGHRPTLISVRDRINKNVEHNLDDRAQV
jgi:hypothetical protein